jgi:hypothetical protein
MKRPPFDQSAGCSVRESLRAIALKFLIAGEFE